MKAENYINVVNNLNDILFKNCESLYNQGLIFTYSTNGYIDYIMFGDTYLFDSDNDTGITSEQDLELLLKEKVLDAIKELQSFLK